MQEFGSLIRTVLAYGVYIMTIPAAISLWFAYGFMKEGKHSYAVNCIFAAVFVFFVPKLLAAMLALVLPEAGIDITPDFGG